MSATDGEFVLAGGFEAATRDQWMDLVSAVLAKGAAATSPEAVAKLFDKRLLTRTLDGLTIQPLYTAADLPEGGAPPVGLVRHGGEPWDIRVRVDGQGDGSAAVEELEGGATSVWVDLAGADDVTVDTLDRALTGVYLDMVAAILDSGADGERAAEALIALWERRGIAPDAARAGFGLDPLGAYLRRGGKTSFADDLDTATRLARRCAEGYPQVRAVTVDSTLFHEAGATAVTELGCSLATGVAYLRALTEGGLSVDAACGQLEFRLSATSDQFTTIALLRAARRCWARVAEVAGASADAARQRQHAVTSQAMTARYDPWNNLLRTTIAAFAAGVGGADAITVAPHDVLLEPGGSPLGRRLARNVSHVLADESSLARVADPAAGSWYVERLTADLAEAAWRWFTEIEEAGGMAAAAESERVQERVERERAARAERVAHRRDGITGVSEFPNVDEEAPVPLDLAEDALDDDKFRPLSPHRYAEGFEAQRARADRHARERGERPTVFLATLGPLPVHSARAGFATNLFGTAGIRSVTGEPGEFSASGASIACLCSSDSLYAEAGASAAAQLKAAGARRVYLAGRPGDEQARAKLTEAGVDEFVFAGGDAVDVVRRALDVLEVPS
jgi:methylmalonyl-CoA mutase